MTAELTLSHVHQQTIRNLCGGAVHLPGDPGYDNARLPWAMSVDQRPAAVMYPASAEEVADVVRFAADAGLRVAPQGTGHNAGPLGPLDDVILLRTSAMTSVTIDPVARIARAEAGALWLDVVEAASKYGFDGLHGSSPDVGVVGYSLGGGIGWFARQYGLQTNSITAVEIVLADGSLVRADAAHHTDLFWALRGGGGNFGVVTALEFKLYPIETAYAGMLVWDWSHAHEVLSRWAAWAVDAPDLITTSFRILQIPPLPSVPEPMRGRKIVMINGAALWYDEEAAAILAPLRELAPEIDTFSRVPAVSLSRLHMDPEGPTPGVSDTAMLRELPPEAIEAFLAVAGPDSDSCLVAAELRQLGGALARVPRGAGALTHLAGQFQLFGVAIAPTPEMAAAGHAHASRLVSTMRPWHARQQYLNFVEKAVDTSTGYDEYSWLRLRELPARFDPDGLFVANHRLVRK
jgi:FAD/FMN-containing dehydrogenase